VIIDADLDAEFDASRAALLARERCDVRIDVVCIVGRISD
jgi:hypothetical protein